MLLMLFTLVGPMIRRARRAVPVLAVGCLLAAVPAVAARAQTTEADRQRELAAQIIHASADEAAALRALAEIRNRRAPIEARVAELNAELAGVTARLAPLETEIRALEERMVDAEARFRARQAEYEAAKAEVERSAAQAYRSARRGATYDYVTAARPDDLVQGSKYLGEVNESQRAVTRKATELRNKVDEERRDLRTRRDATEAAATEVRDLRDRVTALRAEIEPARARAAAEAAAEEQQLRLIRSQKASWEREYAELQAASDAIAARLRGGGSGSGQAGACEFRPTPGTISSGFGTRTDPLGAGTGFHSGIDIAVGSGTPIRACRSGTVTIAGWQGGYGNTVVIDHGGGMATLYAHQSSVAVAAGQTVLPGQVIGYVGSTGRSTGPHLHFEVRISGNPVNPMAYL